MRFRTLDPRQRIDWRGVSVVDDGRKGGLRVPSVFAESEGIECDVLSLEDDQINQNVQFKHDVLGILQSIRGLGVGSATEFNRSMQP